MLIQEAIAVLAAAATRECLSGGSWPKDLDIYGAGYSS